MTGEPRVVIVGGGLGAVRTAQAVRDLGHGGEVRILSAEAEIPYDRPPLSKGHLAGSFDDTALALLPPESYAGLDIRLELDQEVVRIESDDRTVVTADGTRVPYDRLVIATGAQPRSLPILADRPGAFPLRTATQSRRLAASVRKGRPIAVVGGGFIGLEVAATARTAGCDVHVVEAQPAPLLGAVGPDIARWLRTRHEQHGVEFHCGVTVVAAEDRPGGGERLGLSDGTSIDAEAVVVGVGVVRDTAWLAEAGLEIADGLVCDEHGHTNLPDIFGVGDIVCRRTAAGSAPVGHWTAAGTSARLAAHALLGLDVPDLVDDGFFWSDQYDLRLQSVGRINPGDEFAVAAGDMNDNSFVAQFRADGEVTAILAVNNPRQFLRHRRDLRATAAAPR
ncbi:NAD(P)/FAD-dependent oxidoreductase [Pseudonocardia sp. GCM10023141]|uniref:NAD(P)/FAD-dependent oxidoreductase n=1 Tax=Pseudonocardia sp. GCM10023141 TaxID=3252653 RepID=UPI00361C5A9C